MSREENVIIFNETEKICKTNEKLKEAIKQSSAGQRLILETDEFSAPTRERFSDKAEVVVSKKRSYEAASNY